MICPQVGYYLSNSQCVPCDCHSVGSNDTVCDVTSGQCSCLPNISGRTCNETIPGYYFRALDYIRFEAEDVSSYPEVCGVYMWTKISVWFRDFLWCSQSQIIQFMTTILLGEGILPFQVVVES